MQKILEVNYPTGLYIYSPELTEEALNENIKAIHHGENGPVIPHKYWRTLDISFATEENSK